MWTAVLIGIVLGLFTSIFVSFATPAIQAFRARRRSHLKPFQNFLKRLWKHRKGPDLNRRFCVLDTETVGVDRVLTELAATVVNEQGSCLGFFSLVCATDKDRENALEELGKMIIQHKPHAVVGHNVKAFDMDVIARAIQATRPSPEAVAAIQQMFLLSFDTLHEVKRSGEKKATINGASEEMLKKERKTNVDAADQALRLLENKGGFPDAPALAQQGFELLKNLTLHRAADDVQVTLIHFSVFYVLGEYRLRRNTTLSQPESSARTKRLIAAVQRASGTESPPMTRSWVEVLGLLAEKPEIYSKYSFQTMFDMIVAHEEGTSQVNYRKYSKSKPQVARLFECIEKLGDSSQFLSWLEESHAVTEEDRVLLAQALKSPSEEKDTRYTFLLKKMHNKYNSNPT